MRYQLTAHPLFIYYGFFKKSLLLYDPEMEALLFQGILDFLDVGGVAGLHGDTEHAGIHLVAVGRTVVMNSRDVAAQACDDGGYLYQLARLVVQLHLDGAETSTLYQSTVDDTVEDGYVDVTAAYHADGLQIGRAHV